MSAALPTLTRVPHADAETLARRVLALLAEARRDVADRDRWDHDRIDAALALIDRAFAAPGVGATTLRAAIECLHSQAPSAAATDWRRVAALYDHLVELEPTPEVEHERTLAHRRAGRLPHPRGASR